MSGNNWGKENAQMFPAYLMFIEEFINKDINILADYNQNIQFILDTVLQNKYEDLFFSLSTNIVLKLSYSDLKNSGFLSTILVAILNAIGDPSNINPNKGQDKLGIRGNLVKGIIMFFALCMVTFTYEAFIQDVSISNYYSNLLVGYCLGK